MAEPKLRVLVVDDERFFREAVSEALGESGIECEAVASGADALSIVRDPQVAVVVLDVTLQDESGIDVLRQLRAERPAVRVIVLSAHTDQELVLEALRLDASDYLAKPLHDEELVLAVRRALAAFDVESSWQRLRERLRRVGSRTAELEALADGGHGEGELAAFASATVDAVADVLEASKTSLMVFDEEANELRVAAATGSEIAAAEMDPVALGEGVAGVALSLGEAVVVDDVYTDARFTSRTLRDRYESASLAVAPLRSDGRALGVLCATDRLAGTPLGEDELALLRILSLPVTRFLAQASSEPRAEDALELDTPEAGDALELDTVAGEALELETDDGLQGEPEGLGRGLDEAPPHDPELASAAADAELAREICEALTLEVEPERIISGVLRRVASRLPADVLALHLIDNPSGDLVLEGRAEGEGGGDRERLPRDRGLTGTVLQTGTLVATERPQADPRFDPDVDTAADGAIRPLLCVPLHMRGKVLGVFRAFPREGEGASARTAEILSAALSAAVRNVLLYRSLLETIDEVAEARRESGGL